MRINEDFFDDNQIEVSNNIEDEVGDISLKISNYTYSFFIDCRTVQNNNKNLFDFDPKWKRFIRLIPEILLANDIIKSKDEITDEEINISSDSVNPQQGCWDSIDEADVWTAIKMKKVIMIFIRCKGTLLNTLRSKETIRNIESTSRTFAKCVNNMNLKKIKFSFGINLNADDLDEKDTQVSISQFSDSAFANLNFVDSLSSNECEGTEFPAKKVFTSADMNSFGQHSSLCLHRLVRNYCITGEQSNLHQYAIPQFKSGKGKFCSQADIIHNDMEVTKQLVQTVLDEISSKPHNIRPFFVKVEYNIALIVYAFNIIVTIDDERYVAHLQDYYPISDFSAQNAPSACIYDIKEILKNVKTVTGNGPAIRKLMKNNNMIPDNFK